MTLMGRRVIGPEDTLAGKVVHGLAATLRKALEIDGPSLVDVVMESPVPIP
jgi:hypothetical protein